MSFCPPSLSLSAVHYQCYKLLQHTKITNTKNLGSEVAISTLTFPSVRKRFHKRARFSQAMSGSSLYTHTHTAHCIERVRGCLGSGAVLCASSSFLLCGHSMCSLHTKKMKTGCSISYPSLHIRISNTYYK